VHFNVTAHTTAEWTGSNYARAFPFEQSIEYLLRERDALRR